MAARESFFGRPLGSAPNSTKNSFNESAPKPLATGTSTVSPAETPAAEKTESAAKPVTPLVAASNETRGSQLIVGPKIRMKGVEIVDCDTLVVEGHIEATMDSRVIQIAAGGTFTGTAGIDEADIHGGFSGELVARKCLTIHATGKVSGKIRYKKLVVEEGGEISGEVSKLTEGQPTSISRSKNEDSALTAVGA